MNVQIIDTPGLSSFSLSTLISAASFVDASARFNATSSNFANGIWAVSRITAPPQDGTNGTVFTQTPAIRSMANCQIADKFTVFSNITSFNITGRSGSDCHLSIIRPSTSEAQFGVETALCNETSSPPPLTQQPAVFWFVGPLNNANIPSGAMVFCRPQVEIFNVSAAFFVTQGQVLSVNPISDGLNLSSLSPNTNNPFSSLPLNGIGFNATFDSFRNDQTTSIRVTLSSVVFQNVSAGFPNNDQLENTAENIYSLYLSLIAKSLYFVPTNVTVPATTKTIFPRLFMVDVAAHILSGILLLFSALAGFIHRRHYQIRDNIILPLQPGTLASAVAFTAGSDVSKLFEPNADQRRLKEILKEKRFTLDRSSGRVVVTGGMDTTERPWRKTSLD